MASVLSKELVSLARGVSNRLGRCADGPEARRGARTAGVSGSTSSCGRRLGRRALRRRACSARLVRLRTSASNVRHPQVRRAAAGGAVLFVGRKRRQLRDRGVQRAGHDRQYTEMFAAGRRLHPGPLLAILTPLRRHARHASLPAIVVEGSGAVCAVSRVSPRRRSKSVNSRVRESRDSKSLTCWRSPV